MIKINLGLNQNKMEELRFAGKIEGKELKQRTSQTGIPFMTCSYKIIDGPTIYLFTTTDKRFFDFEKEEEVDVTYSLDGFYKKIINMKKKDKKVKVRKFILTLEEIE